MALTPRKALAFFGACWALGLALRLVYPGDLEFKADEAYMFYSATGQHGYEPWPELGMPSGAGGLRNPGLSIWIFSAFARLFALDTPAALSLFVAASFLLALLGAAAWAWRALKPEERVVPLLALGLSALNPHLVLYTRKIWAQSLLPLLLLPSWIGLARSSRPWGAFLWSFAGTLLGQVHMSGFLWAAATGLGVLLDPFKRRATRWGWVVAGALAGCAGLVPWVRMIFGAERGGSGRGLSWPTMESLNPRTWIYALDTLAAFPLQRALGSATRGFYVDFAGGLPALLAALQVVLVASTLVWGWKRRDRFEAWERGMLVTMLLLLPLVYALSGLRVYRHYLIVAFPALWVLWARLALWAWPRRVLQVSVAFALAQAGTSFLLLSYLHARGGSPGDFGTSLRVQDASRIEKLKVPPPPDAAQASGQ